MKRPILAAALCVCLCATAQEIKISGITVSRAEGAHAQNQQLAARYEAPWLRQFVAFSYDTHMQSPSQACEYYPANEMLEWTNASIGNPSGTRYEWSYTDPTTGEPATATTTDLRITYQPRTPIYSLPVLTASCSGYEAASYQGHAQRLQAAGMPTVDGNTRAGIWSMDAEADGLFAYIDGDVPVFGYSAASDAWWCHYVSPSGTYQAQLDSYLNVLIVPDSPMVVNGAIAYGVGQVGDDAMFKLEIYALRGADWIPDDQPLASAICRGSEMTRLNGDGAYPTLVIPFEFDEPQVISGRQAEAYAVFVSGFRGPDVTWYAPLMAERPNDLDICYAQYVCHVSNAQEAFDNIYMTAYFQNSDGDDLCSTFAISLGAYYPWLEIDDTAVTLDGEATIPVYSCYAPDQLAVSGANGAALPMWLDAAFGRADDGSTVLTLAGSPDADTDLTLEVTGLAVSQTITVHAQVAGLDTLTGADATVVSCYDLTGHEVTSPTLPGIYILRLSDGRTRKVALLK